jgi:hypothetical protein
MDAALSCCFVFEGKDFFTAEVAENAEMARK